MMMTAAAPSMIHRSRSFLSLQLVLLTHGVFKGLLSLFLLLRYATAQPGALSSSSPPPTPDSFAFGPKFNPTIVVVMVIFVGAFCLMGFFSVYIRKCAERRFIQGNIDTATAASVRDGGRSSMRVPGLGAAVIETFPTFLYSAVKGLKIGKGALECAVCLNEFEEKDTLRLIPKCSHVFHTECIDTWLSSHTTCPVCRTNLVPKPGELRLGLVRIFEPDNNPVEPVPPYTAIDLETQNHVRVHVTDGDCDGEVTRLQSPDVNLLHQTSRNGLPRSWSSGWQLNRLFSRSHSTGHSLAPAGENRERFTLRLPEDVRSQLLNTQLHRSKSCVAFPRARSSRRGFRSGSVGRNCFYYERLEQEGRPDLCGFTRAAPFISRAGSVRSSSKRAGRKLSFDGLFLGTETTNEVGEKS